MTRSVVRAAVAGASALILMPSATRASDFSFRTNDFVSTFTSQYRTVGERVNIKQKDCGEQARAICTYEVGDFAVLMVGGSKVRGPADEVTLICAAEGDPKKAASCLLSYVVLIMSVAPSLSKDNRGSILSAMMKVLDVSKETRIKTDDVEFIMQNLSSMGLWFHAKAI